MFKKKEAQAFRLGTENAWASKGSYFFIKKLWLFYINAVINQLFFDFLEINFRRLAIFLKTFFVNSKAAARR